MPSWSVPTKIASGELASPLTLGRRLDLRAGDVLDAAERHPLPLGRVDVRGVARRDEQLVGHDVGDDLADAGHLLGQVVEVQRARAAAASRPSRATREAVRGWPPSMPMPPTTSPRPTTVGPARCTRSHGRRAGRRRTVAVLELERAGRARRTGRRTGRPAGRRSRRPDLDGADERQDLLGLAAAGGSAAIRERESASRIGAASLALLIERLPPQAVPPVDARRRVAPSAG